MTSPDIEAEYSAFLEDQADARRLLDAEIKEQYQDYCDGLADAYLDELEASE